MVIVSHDRHLLRTVTDTLVLVDDGKAQPFDGDLDDYRRWVQEQSKAQETKPETASASAPSKKEQRQRAAERRRQLQPLRNQVGKLEKRMEQLTAENQALQGQLAESSLYEAHNKDRLNQLLEQQACVARELEDVEAKWLAASEELEAIDAGT